MSTNLRTLNELKAIPDTPLKFELGINRDQIQGWLTAAVAKLKDAQRTENSGGTRMDCAYDAVLMCCLAILASQSYRVSSEPGHHAVALEAAASSIGYSRTRFNLLTVLKNWRNLKYSAGFDTAERNVNDAVKIAEEFLTRASEWLQENKPEVFRR